MAFSGLFYFSFKIEALRLISPRMPLYSDTFYSISNQTITATNLTSLAISSSTLLSPYCSLFKGKQLCPLDGTITYDNAQLLNYSADISILDAETALVDKCLFDGTHLDCSSRDDIGGTILAKFGSYIYSTSSGTLYLSQLNGTMNVPLTKVGVSKFISRTLQQLLIRFLDLNT